MLSGLARIALSSTPIWFQIELSARLATAWATPPISTPERARIAWPSTGSEETRSASLSPGTMALISAGPIWLRR